MDEDYVLTIPARTLYQLRTLGIRCGSESDALITAVSVLDQIIRRGDEGYVDVIAVDPYRNAAHPIDIDVENFEQRM